MDERAERESSKRRDAFWGRRGFLRRRELSHIVSALLGLPAAALGHDGRPDGFHDILLTWSFDPLVIGCLAVSGIAYTTGLRRLWREGGVGHGIGRIEAVAFAGGWFSMCVALVSPLHPLGEVLFSAHMTQHEILMLISAPLFVIGRPFIAAMWAVPRTWRRKTGGLLNSPSVKHTWAFLSNAAVAWIAHAVALWVWHVPWMFQATLRSDLVHSVQHASFFGTALLFWWAILFGKRGLPSYGAGVLYLFTTMVQSGLLGIFLTLTLTVWYPAYAATTASFGLSPIEDQQIGGLIMWIPAGLVYMFAALVMFHSWLRESEKRVLAREQRVKTATAGHQV